MAAAPRETAFHGPVTREPPIRQPHGSRPQALPSRIALGRQRRDARIRSFTTQTKDALNQGAGRLDDTSRGSTGDNTIQIGHELNGSGNAAKRYLAVTELMLDGARIGACTGCEKAPTSSQLGDHLPRSTLALLLEHKRGLSAQR